MSKALPFLFVLFSLLALANAHGIVDQSQMQITGSIAELSPGGSKLAQSFHISDPTVDPNSRHLIGLDFYLRCGDSCPNINSLLKITIQDDYAADHHPLGFVYAEKYLSLPILSSEWQKIHFDIESFTPLPYDSDPMYSLVWIVFSLENGNGAIQLAGANTDPYAYGFSESWSASTGWTVGPLAGWDAAFQTYKPSAYGVSCDKLSANAQANMYLPTSMDDSQTKCNVINLMTYLSNGFSFGNGDFSDRAYLCVGNVGGQAQLGDVFYYKNSVYVKSAIGAPFYNYGPNQVKLEFDASNAQNGPVSAIVPDQSKPVLWIPEFVTVTDSAAKAFKLSIGGADQNTMSFVPLGGTYFGRYGDHSSSSPNNTGDSFGDQFVSWRGTEASGSTDWLSFEYPVAMKYAHFLFNASSQPGTAYEMRSYIGGYLDYDFQDDRLDDWAQIPRLMPASLIEASFAGRRVTSAETPLAKSIVVTDFKAGKAYHDFEKYYFHSYNAFDAGDKQVKSLFTKAGYETVFTQPLPVCVKSGPGNIYKDSFVPSPSNCPNMYKTAYHNVSIAFLGDYWTIYGMDNFDKNGGGVDGVSWPIAPKVTLGKLVVYKPVMKVNQTVFYPNGLTVKLVAIQNSPGQKLATFKIFDSQGAEVDTLVLSDSGTSEYDDDGIIIKLLSFSQLPSIEAYFFNDKLELTHGLNVNGDNPGWKVRIIGGGPAFGASLKSLQVYNTLEQPHLQPGGEMPLMKDPKNARLLYAGTDVCQ